MAGCPRIGKTWRVSHTLNGAASIPITPPSESPVSAPEQTRILEEAIGYKVSKGNRLAFKNERTAVLNHGKPPNHILHLLLSVLTLGLWIPVWILASIFGGEKTSTLSVDDHGRVTQS